MNECMKFSSSLGVRDVAGRGVSLWLGLDTTERHGLDPLAFRACDTTAERQLLYKLLARILPSDWVLMKLKLKASSG